MKLPTACQAFSHACFAASPASSWRSDDNPNDHRRDIRAQLRADDQNVLWLIDATDGRYQLAVALQGGWRIVDATPSERVLLTAHGFGNGRVQ
jgi:hypothetical protein